MIISNNKKCKIVVGVNSLVSTTHAAYSNHCQFWYRLGKDHADIDFILVNPSRMGIDRMRNMCATVAIEHDADYILFLDDDVLVPVGSLSLLLAADADIVAGDVLIRGYPFNHMAFRHPRISNNLYEAAVNLTAIREWDTEERNKLVDVDAVGFSYCLLKVSMMKRIPGPWFITGPRNTEDIYYCMLAQQYGATIKVDTRVECAHILWSEVISPSSKANYKKFMEDQYGVREESLLAQDPTPAQMPKPKVDMDDKQFAGYRDRVAADQKEFSTK